jgi:hypothetical protein
MATIARLHFLGVDEHIAALLSNEPSHTGHILTQAEAPEAPKASIPREIGLLSL